jgi:hypothetical protein
MMSYHTVFCLFSIHFEVQPMKIGSVTSEFHWDMYRNKNRWENTTMARHAGPSYFPVSFFLHQHDQLSRQSNSIPQTNRRSWVWNVCSIFFWMPKSYGWRLRLPLTVKSKWGARLAVGQPNEGTRALMMMMMIVMRMMVMDRRWSCCEDSSANQDWDMKAIDRHICCYCCLIRKNIIRFEIAKNQRWQCRHVPFEPKGPKGPPDDVTITCDAPWGSPPSFSMPSAVGNCRWLQCQGVIQCCELWIPSPSQFFDLKMQSYEMQHAYRYCTFCRRIYVYIIYILYLMVNIYIYIYSSIYKYKRFGMCIYIYVLVFIYIRVYIYMY